MDTLTLAPTSFGDADLSRHLQHGPAGETTFEVAVKGAHCANCLGKIERGVGAMPGVTMARLNLSTGKLAVSWRGAETSPGAVIARVVALGYEAQPYDAPAVLNAEASEGRFLLRSLAVAGFGTVFVMGLTDGVWYGGGDMNAATRDLFFWLAAAVSVPVSLYASLPFFRSAWRSLSKRSTNMDVPISLAIVLSLGLSVYQTAIHGRNTYFDAAAMLAFLLLIGRYLDFLLRDRARGAAQHLLTLQSLLARRLKPDGAVETVAAGDLMPGDRILLASGERVPVDGRAGGDTELDVSLVTGESAPVKALHGTAIHAGSIVTGAALLLEVTARLQDSLVADLARLLEAGQQTRSAYVRLADRAARAYVPFVTGLAALVFLGWLVAGAGVGVAVTDAITVLIITCPCALGLAVPAVQIVATGRLFARGLFVKSGDALERLAEIDMAVFDKTGTLTLGTPRLQNGAEIAPESLAAAARLARASRHPLARALAAAAGEGGVAAQVREVAGQGLEAQENGRHLRLGNAAWCGLRETAQSSELWFVAGDDAAVCFRFQDDIRPETIRLLRALEARGIAVEMLTGDREAPAAALAAQAGIARWMAGVEPKAKAAHMEALRAQGRRVLMIGDGINDAAALALAHASLAPGSAADVSQRAADMVLRGESLLPLVEAIDVARKARRLVLENFAVATLYNLVAIPLAAFGAVTPLVAAAAMAGSSLVVTLNALRLARQGKA
ncbi:MAG: heavy metal translocating P-type ATPase [Rhizomicrobium sp.]